MNNFELFALTCPWRAERYNEDMSTDFICEARLGNQASEYCERYECAVWALVDFLKGSSK